jgi:hypothetical protein
MPVSEPGTVVIARRRPSWSRRASISFPLNPLRPPPHEEEEENKENNVMREVSVSVSVGGEDSFHLEDDMETGNSSKKTFQPRRITTTRVVRENRASIMDIAHGKMSVMGFVENRTRSQKLGFHERSEQINIMKMEKVWSSSSSLMFCYCMTQVFTYLLSYSFIMYVVCGQARLHHVRSLSSKNSLMDGVWFYASAVFYDPHAQFLVLWYVTVMLFIVSCCLLGSVDVIIT